MGRLPHAGPGTAYAPEHKVCLPCAGRAAGAGGLTPVQGRPRGRAGAQS